MAATQLLLRNDDELGFLVDPACLLGIESAVRSAVPGLGHLLDYVPWVVLRRAALLTERIISPGFVAHYALRKRAVRECLAESIAADFRQVVLVGAGFDMLGESVPSGVRVFEVDHSATQSARLGSTGRPTVFVATDLSTRGLRSALEASPLFDSAIDTVFVAEGLLMYLSAERVNALLGDVCNQSSRVRLILTAVTPDANGRVRIHSQRAAVDWCMQWLDEPFQWGESADDLVRTLRAHALQVERMISTTDLRDEILPLRARKRMPHPTGELVVVATRDA